MKPQKQQEGGGPTFHGGLDGDVEQASNNHHNMAPFDFRTTGTTNSAARNPYFCDDDLEETPPEAKRARPQNSKPQNRSAEPQRALNHNGSSNSRSKFVFSNEDVTHRPRDRLKSLAEWAILLISLAEALFTVFFFDEDKFSFFTVALVFGIFAFCDTLAKSLAACTRTKCDDFLVSLTSEGIQAYLYLYFCDFSNISMLWIPIMGGTQWVLIYVVFLCTPWRKSREEEEEEERKKQECEEAEEDGDDDEGANNNRKTKEEEEEEPLVFRTMKFVGSKTIGVSVALSPLLYLLTQPESPFRTKTFEVLLTAYLWVMEVGTNQFYKDFNSKAMQQGIERFVQKSMGMPPPPNQPPPKEDTSSRCYRFGLVTVILVVLAFAVYIMVLSWIWWYDPEIRDKYDKILTMIFMVCSGMWCCCFGFYGCVGCCFCCLAPHVGDLEDAADGDNLGNKNGVEELSDETPTHPADEQYFDNDV